jgi:hypothetical protein
MIHSHPQRSTMPVEDKRQNNRQRRTRQKEGYNRYTWVRSCDYSDRNNHSCYKQLTNNQVEGCRSAEVAYFTSIKDKMTDGALLVHFEPAPKDFSFATDGTTPQQSSDKKYKCFFHGTILYVLIEPPPPDTPVLLDLGRKAALLVWGWGGRDPLAHNYNRHTCAGSDSNDAQCPVSFPVSS